MSTPGFSLFQGGESIQLDTSLNRAEEEEANQDKRRRDEELNKDLQNAFDDLLDDDDTTVDTSKFQSDIFPHADGKMIATSSTNCNPAELHQLKMMLESRTRELEHFTKLAHEERKNREDLEKRLAMSEAERERAILSRKSTHELLVESKEKCSNQENTIQNLKAEIKMMESKNNDMAGKLETSQALLAAVQHKYHMVEKGVTMSNDRHTELKLKHLEEKHRVEIDMLQQQLESVNNKLDKKSAELDTMNSRYVALQRTHETMLIEKSSKINELSRNLSESQKQCEELMCKHDYSQENIRLQRLVAALELEIAERKRTIDNLQSRLDKTVADLNALDSVLQQTNDESFRRLSRTHGQIIGSTPMTNADQLTHLKDELYRAIANLRSKRDEIRTMQASLDSKNLEIKNLKEEENKILVELNTLKDDNARIKSKLKLFEDELEELRAEKSEGTSRTKEDDLLEVIKRSKEEIQAHRDEEAQKYKREIDNLESKLTNLQIDLEEIKQERDSIKDKCEQMCMDNKQLQDTQAEVEKLKFLLQDSQKECDRLNNVYLEICNEKEGIAQELSNLRNKDIWRELQIQKTKSANLSEALQLAEVKSSELSKLLEAQSVAFHQNITHLTEQIERERAEVKCAPPVIGSHDCTKCSSLMGEYVKIDMENITMRGKCAVLKKEINILKLQLMSAKEQISELSDKLLLVDDREKLIKELRAKAKQFEEFVQLHSSCRAQSTSDSKEISESHTDNQKLIEARVREEVSNIFMNELRNTEQRYQSKMIRLEEESVALQRDLENVNADLMQRQKEVEVLSQAIISERASLQELIGEKQSEFQKMLRQQDVVIHRYRSDLAGKTKRINELLEELNERNDQIEAERQSMKAVMTQWEEQQKSHENLKEEYELKLDEMKKLYESTIASWRAKYNSAKKTAANYKRYSEDKENHMIEEYNRIKAEYDASLANIELRMKRAFGKKEEKMPMDVDKPEKNVLPNDLESLSEDELPK